MFISSNEKKFKKSNMSNIWIKVSQKSILNYCVKQCATNLALCLAIDVLEVNSNLKNRLQLMIARAVKTR